MRDFYKSQAWDKCRTAYLSSVNHICERCGAPAVIVHHKTHLNESNYTDPDVSLNPDRLEALCIPCHNTEHYRIDACEDGYTFDADGNLVRADQP